MQKREIELDLLRIIAIFAVIAAHTCGMETHNLEISDVRWQTLSFISGLMAWSVPAFVMISGRFFLDNERKVDKQKIIRAILRLVIAFSVWTVLYQIFYIMTGAYDNLNWKGIVCQAITGPYHFWFLWMITGLYLITPFLRKICSDKKLMEYYIILYLIFETIVSYIIPNLPVVGEIVQKMHMDFVIGFTGLFIAGYYFKKYPVSEKLEIVLYVFAAISIFLSSYGTVFKSIEMGVNNDWFTQFLRPNVSVEAFAVYTLFTKRIAKHQFGQKSYGIISNLSVRTFGVYLSHAFVLELLAMVGLSPIMCSPFVMVPIIAIIAFAASFLLSLVCSKIPIIGRYIV